MAQDNTPLYLLMGGMVVLGLYLTKQFCPGAALATDAFDGKLCPSDDNAITDILTNTVPDLNVGGKLGDVAGAWVLAEKNLASCPRSFVKSGANCVCNTLAKKCAGPNAFVELVDSYGNINSNGNCKCFRCNTGFVRSGGKCVKTGTPGIVTGGGSAGTTGGSGSGNIGGCNKVCTGGFVKNNSPCSCVCNVIAKKCTSNQIAIRYGSGASQTCKCYSCNPGFTPAPDKTKCIPMNNSSNGVAVNNAKLFIADVINRTVQACCGRAPGTTRVVQGYPSAISSLAKMNNYSQNKILAYNNRPFAKTFRSVVMAIVGSYKLNLSAVCTRQMSCINSYSLKECGLL